MFQKREEKKDASPEIFVVEKKTDLTVPMTGFVSAFKWLFMGNQALAPYWNLSSFS